ncbi:MAG: polyketide cyclase / dehydrase and lipid transport [Frankiales bacterium]|nr:polyketide cyclase / dehydrase and lipid transport [Frankiales bacterium]
MNLVDETWIDAAPPRVAAAVAEPAAWLSWWPGLTLTLTLDRGLQGRQWAASGPWEGSIEIWLEPMLGGVLLHHYLRLRRAESGRGDGDGPLRRRIGPGRHAERDFAWHAKRVFWQLKDELEATGNLRPCPISQPSRSS